MVQAIADDDISVIEVERNFPCKAKTGEFNPSASPTTPLQYYDNPAVLDDATRIQRSIQFQLLNYMKNLGVEPPSSSRKPMLQPSNVYGGGMAHSDFLHLQQSPAGSLAPVEHPSIALLQQRFQRLERDKEMRQAKQLHRGYSNESLEAGKPSSADCSLQLSLHDKNPKSSSSEATPYLHRNRSEAWTQSLPSPHTSPKSAASNREQAMFPFLRDKNIEGELRNKNPAAAPLAQNYPLETTQQIHSKKRILSLLPTEAPCSDQSKSNFRFAAQQRDSPSSSAYPYSRQGETQYFLKDWDIATVKEKSLPIEAMEADEVDTSLHL